MSEWQEKNLADVMGLKRGMDLPTPQRRPGPYPVLGSSGITGWHDEAPVSGPGVTIGRSGASIGVATWHDGPFWPLNTTLYVEDFKGNDPRFVYRLLHGIDFNAFNSGSAQPSLNRNFIAQIKVMLPGLREQQVVAGVLGALDDKISINERIAVTADELASVIFRSEFSQALDHVTAGTPLPSGWGISTVGASTVTVEAGKRPKGGVAQYSSGVPSIGAESVIGLGKFEFAKTKFVPEEFFIGMRRGVVQDRDILVYKDGGKPGDFKPHITLFGEGFPFSRMCINEHVYRVQMAADIGQEFGYYWLSSVPIMAEMRRRGTGAAIPGMNSTAFKGIPVVIPPSDKIASFKAAVAPLVDRSLMAALESRSLAILRDTLFPQLMSGRLRIKDAEKIVEDNT